MFFVGGILDGVGFFLKDFLVTRVFFLGRIFGRLGFFW